jgi:hypothetical protein
MAYKVKSPECDKCTDRFVYSDQWDAYYCAQCNEWKEVQCSDPNCNFCPGRPRRPCDAPSQKKP